VLALPGVHTEAFAELIPTPEAFAELIPTMEEGFIWCPRTVDYNVWLAVAGDTSAAWSSDGRYLAFNGAMDGPSADVYVYALEDGSITRLTTGPTQSVDPVWSPDNRYIVHGAADQREMGGWDMTGVWTVRPADGMTRLLFSSDVAGSERVIGWVSDTTYLGESCEILPYPCGNLRTVNVETGQITSILSATYDYAAFDPVTQTILISVPRLSEITSDLAPGFYLLAAGGGEPTPLPGIALEWSVPIFWSEESGQFLLNMPQGLIAVSPAGDVTPIAPPATDAACSGTSCAAVREDGSLWVGTMGQELTRLWIGSVHGPTWSPDGQHLFFADAGPFNTATARYVSTLYVTQAPDFRPILTVATITIVGYGDGAFDPLTWVWP
jgi:dipeptidyl aminopeptidase/acylaminoacyl peptidase